MRNSLANQVGVLETCMPGITQYTLQEVHVADMAMAPGT